MKIENRWEGFLNACQILGGWNALVWILSSGWAKNGPYKIILNVDLERKRERHKMDHPRNLIWATKLGGHSWLESKKVYTWIKGGPKFGLVGLQMCRHVGIKNKIK